MSKPLVSDEEIDAWVGAFVIHLDRSDVHELITLVRKRLAERLRETAPSMATTIRLRDALRIVEED